MTWLLYVLASTLAMAATALLVAPLLDGLRRVVRARVQRRMGPPVLQTMYDLEKLFGLQPVLPSSNMLYRALPYAVFSLSLLVAVSAPYPLLPGPSLLFDAVTYMYTVVAATALTCLAGLVIRNPYMNAGAVRELLLLSMTEGFAAATLVGIGVSAGTLRLYGLATHPPVLAARPSWLVLSLSLIILVYIESGYTPFDVAEAETEVLGGPLLEYSGRYYGFMLYASLLKRYALLVLAASICFTGPVSLLLAGRIGYVWAAAASYVLTLVFAAALTAFFSVVEALNPRHRVDTVAKPLASATLLPIIGLVLVMLGW